MVKVDVYIDPSPFRGNNKSVAGGRFAVAQLFTCYFSEMGSKLQNRSTETNAANHCTVCCNWPTCKQYDVRNHNNRNQFAEDNLILISILHQWYIMDNCATSKSLQAAHEWRMPRREETHISWSPAYDWRVLTRRQIDRFAARITRCMLRYAKSMYVPCYIMRRSSSRNSRAINCVIHDGVAKVEFLLPECTVVVAVSDLKRRYAEWICRHHPFIFLWRILINRLYL